MMLTEAELRQFLDHISYSYDKAGHYRLANGDLAWQHYYVKRSNPHGVITAICYFFHDCEPKVFEKSPSWGSYECEFTLRPKMIEHIRSVLKADVIGQVTDG